MRRILFPTLSVFLGLLITLLALELILRLLPVNEGLRALPVNQENPVLRFEPCRTVLWSKGWNFSLRNRVRINNYGFVSDIDYERDHPLPLVAIIGDSYVEAVMVPYEQTGAGRLSRRLEGVARVYTFGASGSALTQYLAYAKFVRDEFRPDRLVILIVGNDFDESLLKYKADPGFHYFREEDGGLTLTRVDYSISFAQRLVRRSAMGMYLATNLNLAPFGLQSLLAKLPRSLGGQGESYVGNTSSRPDPDRLNDSKRAIDAFLSLLPTTAGLAPSSIVLVVDGIRPQLYDERLGATDGSYFDLMRKHLVSEASDRGFEVIDMQPVFIEHFRRHRQHFESPDDLHWNGLGHDLFSWAVARSRAIASLPRGLALNRSPVPPRGEPDGGSPSRCRGSEVSRGRGR